MTGRLIVGLGSPHGDDQAGWRVISALHARGFPVTSARAASTPADIWNWCRSDHDLTICDANADGHPAGTLRSIVWPTEALPTHSHGTHSLPLGTILELGRE